MTLFHAAVASLLLASGHAVTTDNVSSRLMVTVPRSLYKFEGYEHREALFGRPPYGGSISQTVYYADGDLCDPDVDSRKWSPSMNDEDIAEKGPFILMVNRGGCTFVKKVRHAQRAGAAGVIIADNTCLCTDEKCMATSNVIGCESQEPIMADDGSGGDITIPSFLMFKHDADEIKNELTSGQPVQVEMSWSLPAPDERVEYDLWSVPSDTVSAEFLSNFKAVAKALGKDAYFTPHMYIFDGVRTNCLGNTGENFCYNLCSNDGRYCATDPDNNLDEGISGFDVVKESLRRLCIWKYYGAEDGIGVQWWNYVEQFMERCNTEEKFKDEGCVKNAYKAAGVDAGKIDSCMADSGGLEGNTVNTLLQNEIAAQTSQGVVVLPTAFVNTAAIRGQLSSASVFRAICNGYATGTTPAICDRCMGCADSIACVKNGGACAYSEVIIDEGTVSRHTFASSMLFVVAIFGGVGYWHYQKTRSEMREEVRGILAEYMPLDNQDQDGAVGAPMDFAKKVGATTMNA